MRKKQELPDNQVIIEQVHSEEEEDFTIEPVDSDEEEAKTMQIKAKAQTQEYALMKDIRLAIVQYVKHIGEDRSFFPYGITYVAEAFEQWSLFHCIMTECLCNWSRVRNIFIGSSVAHELLKKPYRVLRRYPIYNMTVGLPPYQHKKRDVHFSTADSRMGLAMEDVIQKSHVAFFSKPLKPVKPGMVVSTRGLIGAACTGDIELLDSTGQLTSLMEVKTLCRAKVPSGIMIPDTQQKARAVIREIFATHGQFRQININTHRGNIFRQESRFVDLELLQMYGQKHATSPSHMKKYDVHSHIEPSLFLKCCEPREGQLIDIYFYNSGDRSGEPAQKFSMSIETLGLTINPWSPTTIQMLWQQCVYSTAYCKTINKDENDFAAWMNLLMVVPYNTDIVNPEPYMIMKMPVFFSHDLCKQLQCFYRASTLEYLLHTHTYQY